MFKKANLSLILILILAFGLRLPQLNGSFWLDEAAQALESARPWSQQLQIIPDFQPPLFHLLVHAALILGRSEWWLRLVGALIPGLMTIWATFQISRRLFNQKTAYLTTLLLTTNSLHIFYSQELRPYSLATMWAVLSWLALIDLSQNKAKNLSSNTIWLNYLLFIISSLLGLFTTYLYPFLFLTQWVYVLCCQRHLIKKMLATSIILGAVFLSWLPTFLQQLQAGGLVRTGLPGWTQVVSFNQLKSIPLTLGKFIFGVVDLEINWFYLAIAGLLLSWLIWFSRQIKKQNLILLFQKIKLPIIWFLVPIVASWLTSFWIPVIQPKRLLFLLPVFYLIIVGLVDLVKSQDATSFWKNKMLYFPIWILLIINTWSTRQYFTQPRLQRENWRSLYDQITHQYPAATTMVVMSAPEAFAPWEWYNHSQYPTLATGTLSVNQLDSLTDTLKPTLDKQYILVFDYLRTLSDPDDQILKTLRSFDFHEVGAIDRPNIGFVRIYVKKTGTISLTL